MICKHFVKMSQEVTAEWHKVNYRGGFHCLVYLVHVCLTWKEVSGWDLVLTFLSGVQRLESGVWCPASLCKHYFKNRKAYIDDTFLIKAEARQELVYLQHKSWRGVILMI